MYIQDLNQFIVVVIAHLLAVISPGPDFVLIARQSFLYGRKTSIYTSLGIASGILIHVFYCIVGLNFLLTNNTLVYVRILCSIYLLYLGINSFLSKTSTLKNNNMGKETQISSPPIYMNDKLSLIIAYRDGFLTNVLNVKATFFFLSLYAYIDTASIMIRTLYGLWMAIVTGLWFVLLSIILTNRKIQENTYNYQFYINKLMGIVLVYLAIKMYLNS